MISGTVDYSGFADADIAIEAVVENMDIKKKVFAEVSNVLVFKGYFSIKYFVFIRDGNGPCLQGPFEGDRFSFF